MTYRVGEQPILASRPPMRIYQRILIFLMNPVTLSGYKWFRDLVGGSWIWVSGDPNLYVVSIGVVPKGWYPVRKGSVPLFGDHSHEYDYDFQWPQIYSVFQRDPNVAWLLSNNAWYMCAMSCGFFGFEATKA